MSDAVHDHEELRSRLDSLSPNLRALLQKRLTPEQRMILSAPVGIPAADRERPLLLSIPQERIWFLEQLTPGSPLFNIKKTFRLNGALDVDALQKAIREIVARHEPLRTRVVATGDGPVQVIDEPSEVHVDVIDLRAETATTRALELERLTNEEARRPFDPSRDLMLRATVIRLRDDQHVLMLVLHHLAADRWSVEILLRELSLLYTAAQKGVPVDLPQLDVQYVDYAVWQRLQLSGDWITRLGEFWTARLADAPVLELPVRPGGASTDSVQDGRYAFSIPADLRQALKELGIRERATSYMLLLAAFKTLLHRSTGQTDLVVGSPVASRDRPELERLIGMFVSTLLIRTDIAGNPSFREVVRSVRARVLEAFAYRDVPFEKLGLWAPGPTRRRSPIRAFFAMQNTPEPALELPLLEVEPMNVSSGTAKFDLSFMIYDTPAGLHGSVRYDSTLFDDAHVERLVCQYMTLLAAALRDPDRPIGSLPLLSETERTRTLATWNATKAPLPSIGVHQLVEAQVWKTPDAYAVLYEDAAVTYRELNARADHLAGVLCRSGIGAGAYVPVLIDRSIELVVALFAIMKSGAAFVPMDPEWPAERIEMLLTDLGSMPVLVNGDSRDHPSLRDRTALQVDAREASAPFASAGSADAPMYAIYTSGSTGKPKAAIVPHRGIVNRLLWMNTYFGPESSAAVLQTTRPVFDSSIWQIFWPLINGGRTVLPSSARALTVDYVSELIEARGITVTDFVPALFNEMVPRLIADAGRKRQWSSLRCLILGGEALSPSTTRRFAHAFPEIRVVSLYGPTEASIGSIYHEVDGRERDRIPIGRPISNTSAIILDPYGHPSPIGMPGELYLGGACVGYGYLSDDAQTDRVFIPNPFPEIDSENLYKTGDLAFYLSDGAIVFLGRADHQVKIRGLRIELGEIETAIRADAAVQDVAVTVRETQNGDRQLVAYVVFADDDAVKHDRSSALNRRLKNRLPDYLVPSSIVGIDALPQLPGGKLDRLALPASRHAESKMEFVAPRTNLEKTIAAIWSDLLDVPRVGIYDDFFDLGGHSLLAMRLVTRLREACDIEPPLRRVFESSTVAGLSEWIEAALWANRSIDVRAADPTNGREEIEL